MTTTRLFKSLAYAIAGIILTSCGTSDKMDSDDVKEAKVSRDYRVEYSEAEQSTNIHAKFKNGKSLIKLPESSSVSVSDPELHLAGQSPQETSVTDTGYGWSLTAAGPSSSYNFTWKKKSGAQVIDNLPMAKVIHVIPGESTFSKSQGIRIKLDRDINASGTKLVVFVKGKSLDGKKPAYILLYASEGDTLKGDSEELDNFKTGKAALKARSMVEKTVKPTKDDLGAVLTSEYRLADLEVNIVD